MRASIEEIIKKNTLGQISYAVLKENLELISDHARSSRYLIYSVTKAFIATAILKLTEDGKLHLDNSLERWFPDIPYAQEIMLKHLLNHTSGLPDYGSLASYHEAVKVHPKEPWIFEEFIQNTLSQKSKIKIEEFNYSNLGYGLLKKIIEQVTKLSFADSLEELIFRPLKLKQTRVVKEIEDLHDLVVAESTLITSDASKTDVRFNYHPGWVFHGVIASTAFDIAWFINQLFEEKILKKESLELMKDPTLLDFNHPYFKNPSYGLGIMSGLLPSGQIYGHTGGGPGYSAVAYYIASTQPTTIVLLSNGENADRLEKALAEIANLLI